MGERFRLLVTGFGPFPGVPSNPTTEVVQEIDGCVWGQVAVSAAVLPTAWAEARPVLDATVERVRPDALIMLGVAPREAIEVERVARNRTIQRPDAVGALPAEGCVAADGPETYPTTLPWAELVEVGAQTSDDAGTYLCNAVFYHALHCHPEVPQRGFVHVPHGAVDAVVAFLQRAAGVLERYSNTENRVRPTS